LESLLTAATDSVKYRHDAADTATDLENGETKMTRNATCKNTKNIPAIPAKGFEWSFDGEFAAMFRSREQMFNDAKAKFLKDAEGNPAYAVKWADGMMTTQYEYECWIICQKHLARVGIGDGFVTKREAVQACYDYLMQDLMVSIGGGQSTCLLTRCDHVCKQVGYKRGLEEIARLLKRLIKSEEVAA
jgi:nitrite reductase/ring-hydroxylating ferredoxin subunit